MPQPDRAAAVGRLRVATRLLITVEIAGVGQRIMERD
jgi:hypothetical protein